MSLPSALDGIIVQLTRRGLPIDYAERAGAELVDHYRDLASELRAAGLDESAAEREATRRLGVSRALVRKTVREYQRRHWCGRWPLLTFLIVPLPLLMLSWIASILAISATIAVFRFLGLVAHEVYDGKITTVEWLLDRAVVVWFLYVIPALVVLLFARIARRSGLGWQWVVLSTCLLAFTAGSVRSGFQGPGQKAMNFDGTPVQADSHLITLWLPFAPGPTTISMLIKSLWDWFKNDANQAGQLLLPLVIAMALIYRARQQSLNSQKLAFDDC